MGLFRLKGGYFLRAVFSEEMNGTICLCERSERATGTGKGSGSDFRVAGRDVDSKSSGLEELLVTMGTLEREMTFMGFNVVIHGILTVLRNATVRATICSVGIFLIDDGGCGGHRGCVCDCIRGRCINFS